MMQEMYEWYMDNLFPEHRRQVIKHAEKDGRDRKKRLGDAGPAPRPRLATDEMSFLEMKAMQIRTGQIRYRPDKSRSKWERIGSPAVASVVDWAIIINPYGWQDPNGRRLKMKAIQRQYDRYQEYSN